VTAGLRVALLLVVSAGLAHAGSERLDNGVVGEGHLHIDVDDYGSFGRWVGPNDSDNYWPPGYQRADPMTNVAENLLFIYAGNGDRGAVALTGHSLLQRLLEGSQGDGLAGDLSLTRTITTGITQASGVATSAFAITDATANLELDIALTQELVVGTAPVTRLEQTFRVENKGTASFVLVWHAVWDINVIFTSSNADDDIVGVGPGLCYVYMHDPNRTSHGGSLSSGGSEVGVPNALAPLPISAYVGAKEGLQPVGGGTPAFSVPTTAVASQEPWLNFKMPASWVNQIPEVGKDIEGSSGALAPTSMAYEHQFTLGPGQVAIIRVHRHWGTIALPCVTVPSTCGNSSVDAGEACDVGGVDDTADCNAMLCTTRVCGDNYVNTVAGETCEPNGGDSADCDAAECNTPSCGDGYLNLAAGEMCDDGEDTSACNVTNCQPPVCGDGIVNAAAGEECDGTALCDAESCTVEFTIGGGCAGCGTDGESPGVLLLLGLLALRRRRP
jgi:MYXO-CTERM domain-containing protein